METTGYANYPEQVERGRAVEARFDRVRGMHITRRATLSEDKICGWDRLDAEWGTVGIKGMCATERGQELQSRQFPFELLNRDGVQAGWGFKKYDTQAYEVEDGFLLVNRALLLKLVFGWSLSLTPCGCVWIPRGKLTPFAALVVDSGVPTKQI